MFTIKKRLICIENSIVVSETTDPDASAELILSDPYGVFPVGRVFSPELYASTYRVPANLSVDENNSVFLIPGAGGHVDAFRAAGIAVNIQPHAKSKHVYLNAETNQLFLEMREYGKRHSVRLPNYALSDKQVAQDMFGAAGFSLFLTTPLKNRADLANFPFDRVILKPAISSNSKAEAHPLWEALYTIKPKAELLDMLDAMSAFSEPQRLLDDPIVIQQVADSNGDKFDALIMSGAVNGNGDVWPFSPIELDTQFNHAGRKAKTVWAIENNTDETLKLQQCVERLLANAGSVNCFYQLQFLRSGSDWIPHDFQHRMTYYMSFGLESLGHIQHKADAIKFVFDRSKQKPQQPAAFGLRHNSPREGLFKSDFVEGANKQEVIRKLDSV